MNSQNPLKDKNGQKLFDCSECKNQFYQKNHKEDPTGKSCNKCYSNFVLSKTYNSNLRTAADSSQKKLQKKQNEDDVSIDKTSCIDFINRDIISESKYLNQQFEDNQA